MINLGLPHLVQVAGLHLQLDHMAQLFPDGRHRLGDAAGRVDVIVLEHGAVGQVEAVVFPAAHRHRVFLQGAQAGQGLAGVGDGRAGPLHQPDIPVGGARHSRHVLQEVECRSLPLEQAAGGALQLGNDVAVRHPASLRQPDFIREGGIQQLENPQGNLQTADHTLRLGHEAGGGAGGGRDHQIGGGVQIIDVLLQRGFNDVVHIELGQQHDKTSLIRLMKLRGGGGFSFPHDLA